MHVLRNSLKTAFKFIFKRVRVFMPGAPVGGGGRALQHRGHRLPVGHPPGPGAQPCRYRCSALLAPNSPSVLDPELSPPSTCPLTLPQVGKRACFCWQLAVREAWCPSDVLFVPLDAAVCSNVVWIYIYILCQDERTCHSLLGQEPADRKYAPG